MKMKYSLKTSVVRFLCGVIALILALPLTSMPAAADDAEEGVKEYTEIHISTPEDLRELAANCTLDSWSVDKRVILDKGIELKGEEFTPIPTFGGIFEGNGKTVNGLSIGKDGSYQGLFRYVQETGKIRDLTVKGSVTPSGSSSYSGGIAGSNSGEISNCRFTGVCSGRENIGGIAGINEETGIIYNCISEGMVYAEHYAGGTAGYNLGTIEKCSNSSNINTRIEQMDIKIKDISIDTLTTTEDAADITDIGGITGCSSGVIRACRNYGNVGYQHKGYNIGGIAGRQSGYITGCINHGKIAGRKEIGGIAGQMEPYKNLTFSESTVSLLRTKNEDLKYSVDRAINDARGYSDAVSDKLDQISDETRRAEEALRIIADIPEGSPDTGLIRPDGSESRKKAAEDLMSSLDKILELMRGLNLTVSEKNGIMADDLQAVSDNLNSMINIVIDARESAQEAVDKGTDNENDVSEEDAQGESDGKVDRCINHGEVNGDVNVGGIAGALAVERDLDPEDDIEVEGDVSVKFDYSTKAVIRDCENHGRIICKKDCAGGIAGSVDLGCIISCSGYGSIESTDGNYTGGIAGMCKTGIRDCNAKCLISGNNMTGGIAGSVSDISGCRSLVRITRSNEKTGAVAGEITGEASGNYYVSEELAGVDGVSYAGIAQPMSWQDMIGLEGIPDSFRHFKLVFMADDKEIYSYEFEYGDSFDIKDLPQIPDKDGCQSYWEDYDYSKLTFDDTVHAVYTQYIASLESGRMRNDEMSVLLVEGNFKNGDTLQAEAAKDVPAVSNRTPDECWTVTIPDDGKDVHRIHFVLPDNVKKADIYILHGEKWTKAKCGKDGAYLVFEAQGSTVTFGVVKNTDYIIYIAIAAAVAALAAASAVIIIRKRRAV